MYQTMTDQYGYGASDTLYPTAEDLAARATNDSFGVSPSSYQDIAAQYGYTPTYGPYEGTDFGVRTNNYDVVADTEGVMPAATAESASAAPSNPMTDFLTDSKNKPLLIGAGVLLVLGAVYMVSAKKGKGGAK